MVFGAFRDLARSRGYQRRANVDHFAAGSGEESVAGVKKAVTCARSSMSGSGNRNWHRKGNYTRFKGK